MSLFRAFSQGETVAPLPGVGVSLRMPRMGDHSEWAALRTQSRAFLQPWEPVWPADDLTRAAFRRRIRRYNEEAAFDRGYAFFIFHVETGALMGGLTLSGVRRGVTQTCTLGYWMGEPFAGCGHMAAAVRATFPFVFSTLGLNRLEAACLPHNSASVRLLERVGFTREGYARQYLCINGRWQDHILYARLKSDTFA